MKKNYIKPKTRSIAVTRCSFCNTSNPTINTNTDAPVVGGEGPNNIEELVRKEGNNRWDNEW